jgi:hypothetical protein
MLFDVYCLLLTERWMLAQTCKLITQVLMYINAGVPLLIRTSYCFALL